MKSKLDVTTTITLDEITYQLTEELSVKELVEFVLQLGDNMSEAPEFYHLLHKKVNAIMKECE